MNVRELLARLSSTPVDQVYLRIEENIAPEVAANPVSSLSVTHFESLDDYRAFRQARGSPSSLQQESSSEDESSADEEAVSVGAPFSAIMIGSELTIKVWKRILQPGKIELDDTIPVRSLLITSFSKPWLIFLINSGEFSAAIFDHGSPNPTIHKSFRRYTVRQKQGGSQLLRDQSGVKTSRSAGSFLRRSNELELLKVCNTFSC